MDLRDLLLIPSEEESMSLQPPYYFYFHGFPPPSFPSRERRLSSLLPPCMNGDSFCPFDRPPLDPHSFWVPFFLGLLDPRRQRRSSIPLIFLFDSEIVVSFSPLFPFSILSKAFVDVPARVPPPPLVEFIALTRRSLFFCDFHPVCVPDCVPPNKF